MKLTALLVAGVALSSVGACGGQTRRGQWLAEAKYGVFIHFLGGGPTWNDRVNAFDVPAVVKQIRRCGAGYVILTLGQNSGYYCSPNATYDKYTGRKPGQRCSKRDLPGELADALAKHGIKLMLYLPSRSPQRDKEAMGKLGDVHERKPAPQAFTKRWSEVIREWSLRYKTKVAGWWFDGAYNRAGWDDPAKANNWNTWAAACRAGNPDSVLAFNPGTRIDKAFARLTAQQDYTAGEQNNWNATPKKHPAPQGMRWHVLSFLGKTWGRCDGPHKPDDWMADYIDTVNQQGGVVSMDVGISQKDGTIYPPHLKQLLAIGARLRKSSAPKSAKKPAAPKRR